MKDKSKKEANITEEEVQAAIKKFLQSGGIINKLPDQKTVSARLVGKRWGSTEMGGDRHG